MLLSDEYNAARAQLIDSRKASAGFVPGIAGLGGVPIDGAGDGSHLLPAAVRKMYEDATTKATLARLEAENKQLQAKLDAALGQGAQPAVSADSSAGAVATAGGGALRDEGGDQQ